MFCIIYLQTNLKKNDIWMSYSFYSNDFIGNLFKEVTYVYNTLGTIFEEDYH